MKPEIKRYLLDMLYGLINGIMVIPVSISFTSIIFKDHHFQAALPSLVKLVLFSSLVHQIAFTLLSSLPFAVGQVQDAGLIFLSAMAVDIATTLSEEHQLDKIISTTAFTLAIATLLLGFVLVGIGRLKLAGVVQYIPMPVIGGYLAYIGYFCGEASLAMMAGTDVKSIYDCMFLLNDLTKLGLVLPGILSGVAIYVLVPLMKSPLTLPACLFVILTLFYLILHLRGNSLADARSAGFIEPLSTATSIANIWDVFSLEKLAMHQIPLQAGRWFGMVVIVGFSSCLDMAAIEMEYTKALDYNSELQTVGWSNVLSGLAGGFTGSYIFTQTVFSLRSGVETRLCGLVIIIIEAAVVMMPIPVTCYVPKFIFGSLLIFIALDLLGEWLVLSYKRMTFLEYIVCITTFSSMLLFGVQVGLVCGIICAMIMFVLAYSSKPSVSISNLQQSRVQRSYHERCLLFAHRGSIVSIHPKGYVFFGTAIMIVEEVKRHTLLFSPPKQNSNKSFGNQFSVKKPQGYGSLSQNIILDAAVQSEDMAADTFDSTEFVVMDFSAVVGVDATAARSCFLLLTRLLRASSVRVVFTGMSRDIERLLRSHAVLDECVVFPEADDALEWCEENVLARLRFEEGWEKSFHASSSHGSLSHSPESLSCSTLLEYTETREELSDAHQHRQKVGARPLKSSGSFVEESPRSLNSGLNGSSLRSSAHNHELETDPLVLNRSRSRSISKSTTNTFAHSMKGSMSHDDLTMLKPPYSLLRLIFDEHLEKNILARDGEDGSMGLNIDDDKDRQSTKNNKLTISGSILEKYFQYKNLSRGRILYDVGSKPKRLFIIAHGSVEVVTRRAGVDNNGSNTLKHKMSPFPTPRLNATSVCTSTQMPFLASDSIFNVSVERVYKMSAGSIVGEAEFLLQKPYSTRCFAATAVGLWILDQDAYNIMAKEDPDLYHELQNVLLKSLSIANLTGIFHLHPSSAYHIGLFTQQNLTLLQPNAIIEPKLKDSDVPSEKFSYIYDRVDIV